MTHADRRRTATRHRAVGLRRLAVLLAAPAMALGLAVHVALAAMALPPTREGVYVYDLAEIWDQSTEDRAQAIVEGIRTRTQAEIAILSWPSDEFDVSTETARADAIIVMDTWGVGREGVNDGLVVLFDMDRGSKDHGQIFAYAGKGFRDLYLAQDESDALVNDDMLPKARDGDIDGALLAGLERLDEFVQAGGNPTRGTKILVNAILAALVLGGGLLVFLLFMRDWWQRGRDAEVPLIDDSVLLPTPPPGMTPALATVLRRDGVDKEGFTTALVDLGHRGLVTFQEADDDKKKVDLVIPPSPLIDPNSLEARRRPLGSAEGDLAGSIADKAVGGVVSWTYLKAGAGAKLFQSFKKDMGRAAKAAGYFREDPNKLSARWLGIGIALIIAVVAFGFFFAFDTSEESANLFRTGREFLVLPMVVAILLGVIVAAFSKRMVARTIEGARALAMALAYRNTLRYEMKAAHTVDEAVSRAQTRLPWITTPDLLTVWAVAFGLKDEVDDLIKETFETARQTGANVWVPAWYSGSGGVSSVGNLSSAMSSIGTTASSSSGSGYGGGSSGGGGGSGGGF
jgi:uncharacterized membrane protein YgcG